MAARLFVKAAQGVGLFPSAVSLLMQTKEDNILNTRIFFRHNASEFTSISVLQLHSHYELMVLLVIKMLCEYTVN